MLIWLKKYFIPYKKNDHKPHVLRRKAVLGILIFVLLIEVCFLFQAILLTSMTNFFAALTPDALISFTNINRQTNDIFSLKTNELLEKAAQFKAQDMASKGYFAHISPDGITPWFWLEKAGYQYSYAGENLAINFIDSKDVIDTWMNSPSHRANILNNNFTEVGISTAKGTYQGRETTFVVEFLAAPALTPIVQMEAVKEYTQQVEQELAPSAETPPSHEMYVVVKGAADQNAATPISPEVKKENELFSLTKCFFSLKCLFSAPRNMTNFIYYLLATIVCLALLLKIFIKLRIQYPALILNGILILIIIVSLVYINHHFFLSQAKIF